MFVVLIPRKNKGRLINRVNRLKSFKRVILGNVRGVFCKIARIQTRSLTLRDEKLLSKVAADYLRLIKKFRKRVFKPNLLIILIIKTIKKTQIIR